MSQISLDPNFSVYHLVKRARQDRVAISHRRTMSLISYEIENASLIDGASTVIFSSFQRMSKFIPQMPRYQRLANIAKKIYVFGLPDVQPPPIDNITYVPLGRYDQLVREWFLVSYSRDYFSALATEELTSLDDPDDQRVFQGVWTFEPDLVQILFEWIANVVAHQHIETGDHDYTRQSQLMNRTLFRMHQRHTKATDPMLAQELKQLIEVDLQPALDHMARLGGSS